jgi:hypothetical protein
MAKVLNAVFGIGIAVVIYIVVLLGIQAFYPSVEYGDYCNDTFYAKPVMDFYSCDNNITVGECRELISEEANYEENERCWEAYDEAQEKYNQNFFIIATLIGTLIIVAAYFFLSITNISAGIACSGIVLILWGFMRGWQSTDNMIKFIVSIIIASVVIFLAVKVNKKLNKN